MLWLWLVLVGFFSLISVMGLSGCFDLTCESSHTRIWTALMVVQGVVIVVGAVLAILDRLTFLIGLAIISPTLWLIAAYLWQTVSYS